MKHPARNTKLIADKVYRMAQQIATHIPGFHKRRGPGKKAGNRVTDRFLAALDDRVRRRWKTECRIQEPVVDGLAYRFDYFIPSEKTVVEIALSLRNAVTEFEKDIFKAILARAAHKPVRRLLLIGKQGAVKRQGAPGPTAIKKWVKQQCGIEVQVKELT